MQESSGIRFKREFIDAIEKEIECSNSKLLKAFKGEKKGFDNPNFIKIIYSINILEDINLLNMLSGNSLFKQRHANILIRDMLEQVIEFIYMIENPSIINEYCNINVGGKKVKSKKHMIKELTATGSKRFKNGRKSVSEMCGIIGEKNTEKDELCLYDIYILLSEECHNSYFHTILDGVGQLEYGDDTCGLTEIQVTYIMNIISKFLKAYKS